MHTIHGATHNWVHSERLDMYYQLFILNNTVFNSQWHLQLGRFKRFGLIFYCFSVNHHLTQLRATFSLRCSMNMGPGAQVHQLAIFNAKPGLWFKSILLLTINNNRKSNGHLIEVITVTFPAVLSHTFINDWILWTWQWGHKQEVVHIITSTITHVTTVCWFIF